MKKVLFLSLLFFNYLFAELDMKSYIGAEYKSYIKTKNDSLNTNKAITFHNEFKYSLETIKLYSKIDVLKDFDENKRDQINLNELYLSFAYDDFDLDIGKKVIFLGSLEAYNLVDIFNRQNYQKDSLDEYKKGAYLLGLNYYLEDEKKLSFYLKYFEEDIKIGSKDSPYYPYGLEDYDESLIFSNADEKPSFVALYEDTYDEDIIADVAFGFFYGYDEAILSQKSSGTYRPFLFQSMKVFTFDTFVVDSTLYKVEASYSKVVDDGVFDIKDFYKIGFGSEYTIENIIQNHNLGFIAEYYKSNSKYHSFDNDIFLALRYAFNDKDSSQILLGLVKDLGNSQKSAYLEYAGRVTDTLNMSADIRYMKADEKSYLSEHMRFGCEIKYYF